MAPDSLTPREHVVYGLSNQELLNRAEARVAGLGLDRAGYVPDLLLRDVEDAKNPARRRVASEDWVGTFRFGMATEPNSENPCSAVSEVDTQ